MSVYKWHCNVCGVEHQADIPDDDFSAEDLKQAREAAHGGSATPSPAQSGVQKTGLDCDDATKERIAKALEMLQGPAGVPAEAQRGVPDFGFPGQSGFIVMGTSLEQVKGRIDAKAAEWRKQKAEIYSSNPYKYDAYATACGTHADELVKLLEGLV
jgi:hypothetical protein